MVAIISDVASRDPLMVILGDSMVEFNQLGNYTAEFAFAELTDIRLHHEVIFPGTKAKPTALDITYRDGVTITWTPLTPTTDAVIVAFHHWQKVQDNPS